MTETQKVKRWSRGAIHERVEYGTGCPLEFVDAEDYDALAQRCEALERENLELKARLAVELTAEARRRSYTAPCSDCERLRLGTTWHGSPMKCQRHRIGPTRP